MPFSEKQKKAAGAELGRRRKGQKSAKFKGATIAQLRDLASGPVKKRPKRPSGRKR